MNKKRKKQRRLKKGLCTMGRALEAIITVVICFVSALLCQAIIWMFDTWNNLSMDELVYQLNAPMEGTNTDMIREFIITCIPGTVIVLMITIIILAAERKNKKWYHISAVIVMMISLILAGYSVKYTWDRLDISNYSKNKNTYSSFVDTNYIDAKDVEITFPEEKRNLIYIFLESMEITYADAQSGGAFENGCIPELVEIAQSNEDFSGENTVLNGGYSMPGATWTIGAMFAQTAGIPLNLPITSNGMDTQETFFPGIITIGDVLEEAGYTQTLYIGSDAVFGGRKLYFTEHGNYQIKDYFYAEEMGYIPEDYYVWWGHEDAYLFEGAKKELLALSEEEEPFNFTMLTVDTHFENGYVCADCQNEFEGNQYANVMACSSRKVQEFISWIQQQDFYENTTIVVCGDHLTMDSDFCNDIDDTYTRKTYTVYINSAVTADDPAKNREYCVFDQYPTTLASLGVTIQGNRLGLGTNLFSGRETLIEQYGYEKVAEEIQKESKLMTELASTVDTENEAIKKREGRNPMAEITVYDYDYQVGYLPVVITNIQNVEDVVSVNIAVWTKEDKSDLQWMQATYQEDGSYLMNINVPEFDYTTGIYQIEVYAVDSQGTQTSVGTANGLVE